MSELRTSTLKKRYRSRTVVQDVSLSVKSGEVVGLLGPNGAGKTTSFYMIVGLVAADGGDIFIDNQNITHLPIHRRARLGLGYLPQEASIFRRLTVAENILAVLELQNYSKEERDARLEELLNDLHITHIRNNQALSLSGGERRRLEITRALVTQPTFLLLDEPFSGIDPIAVAECQEIIRGLKARGLGILLTDHNVRETLAITDRSYLMAEGKVLIAGGASELINDPRVREIYLGSRFQM